MREDEHAEEGLVVSPMEPQHSRSGQRREQVEETEKGQSGRKKPTGSEVLIADGEGLLRGQNVWRPWIWLHGGYW